MTTLTTTPHAQRPIIAVAGPTASGKTRMAVTLAKAFGGEIISADSRQVYRRMDIGTGKDLDEYGSVGHHLIDIVEPGTRYDLHRYLRDFQTALSAIDSRGVRPIVCGGSGLYLESALSGMQLPDVPENPELRARLSTLPLPRLEEILRSMRPLHNTTDTDTPRRAIRAIEIETYYRDHPRQAHLADRLSSRRRDCVILLSDISREQRRERITRRLHTRLQEGMLDEVRSLLEEGIPPENLIYYGLEYKFVTLHLTGHLTYDEMTKGLETAIHQFAKRQMTWLRGMSRRGWEIHPVAYDTPDETLVRLTATIAGIPLPPSN